MVRATAGASSPGHPACHAYEAKLRTRAPHDRAAWRHESYGEGAARVHALAGIDLSIGAGEYVSVMGPSGSGKSTLLNLVSALDTPSSGELYLGSALTKSMNDDALTELRRTKIGLVFQFFN